ncbi:MAG: hypothetical protein ACRCYU_06125, partial [Nocardioides sp.]
MLERGTAPQPGLAPGGFRSAGTMFVALYGKLTLHPWLDPVADQDAYSLFYQRSLAMGWLIEQARGPGLGSTEGEAVSLAGGWAMNDA